MPLGNVLGEFVGKVTSVRISELGGGQRRLEIDSTGEARGGPTTHAYDGAETGGLLSRTSAALTWSLRGDSEAPEPGWSATASRNLQ